MSRQHCTPASSDRVRSNEVGGEEGQPEFQRRCTPRRGSARYALKRARRSASKRLNATTSASSDRSASSRRRRTSASIGDKVSNTARTSRSRRAFPIACVSSEVRGRVSTSFSRCSSSAAARCFGAPALITSLDVTRPPARRVTGSHIGLRASTAKSATSDNRRVEIPARALCCSALGTTTDATFEDVFMPPAIGRPFEELRDSKLSGRGPKHLLHLRDSQPRHATIWAVDRNAPQLELEISTWAVDKPS